MVIYDGVGTNNKTIIKDWYMLDNNVSLLVEFDVMSVSVSFPQDNYYTITPSIYVILGEAVDSNRNHKNDNNKTASSSSLSVDAVAVAVFLSWVRRVWNHNP